MLAERGRNLMVISRMWRWSAARWDGLFSMVHAKVIASREGATAPG